MNQQMLDQILNIGDNEDNLRRLIGQLESDLRVTPFIGAGLTIPLGFPGWSSFLHSQAKKAGIEKSIQQRLDKGEYEDAAEDLLKSRGYRAFQDAIDSNFGSHKLTGQKVKGAVTLLPQLTAGPVITTNFDNVLEEVFEQADSPFEHVVWGAKASSATRAFHQGLRFLLKIHGDAADSADRVLTKSDYEKYYGSADGSSINFTFPLPSLLKMILISRPLLFLGCSLKQDRTVGILKQITHEYPDIAHYAIVERPASDDQFQERSRFLSNHSIRPVWYPNGSHDLIEPLLAHLVDQAPLSAQPTARVWLDNKQIGDFIESMTDRLVLIMGRLTSERKQILDALRDELRKHDYTAVLFDFAVPSTRSIMETLSLLAHLSRFIIIDLTDSTSDLAYLARIVPSLPSVPVLPILESGYRVWGAFDDIMEFPWVLEPAEYDNLEGLLADLAEKYIAPAEIKVKKIRERRQLRYH
jgi:hypothetical protein